jgi:hypothetical protein
VVLADFELAPHELLLLDSAAHTADLVADLQAVVDREGPLRGWLLATLRVPVEDKHLPARPLRGFYAKPEAS